MSGFRCYSVRWSDGTTYESSPLGVQACLKDIADKFLTDTSYHGFSLDTSTNPDGMPVKLVGSYGVYAICFVHTSGSRLMLALNYRGLSPSLNGSSLAPDLGDAVVDRCFGNKVLAASNYMGNYNTMIGGLMACYIPVKSSQDEEQEVFDLTKDITDPNFFPQSASYVISTSSNGAYHYGTPKKTTIDGQYNANIGQSLISVGTSASISHAYNSIYGAIASWKKCYSIICDDKETIIITSQCVDASIINPPVRFAFLGKIQNPTTTVKVVSSQQSFRNHDVTRIGATYAASGNVGYVISELDYSTTAAINTSYLSNLQYISSFASGDAMKNIKQMTSQSGSNTYPSPFPYQNTGIKTVDGVSHYVLYPICFSGGTEKMVGFLSDNLRVTPYRSDLSHNAFFNNKEWCTLGYTMIFSSRADLTSQSTPSINNNSTSSSYLWHLVFRYDQGNEDSPFGPV